MSYAFEVSEDDVVTVFARHLGVAPGEAVGHARFRDAVGIVRDNSGRLEDAALWYDSLDDQTVSAQAEMESLLIEHGVLGGARVCAAPGPAGRDEVFCDECGQPMSVDSASGVSCHLKEDGLVDFDQDADHVAFTRESSGGWPAGIAEPVRGR